jgi:hypothetical protein
MRAGIGRHGSLRSRHEPRETRHPSVPRRAGPRRCLLRAARRRRVPQLAPPPDAITRIEGNKADGFTVHHYDGTSISPPTDSEARAECSEYDRRVQRVRCRTEVRVWYDALGDTQTALRLAWRSRH